MKKIAFVIFAALCLVGVPGCRRENKEHGHEHHHEAEQYVAYSKDYELFAEAEPFLVGHASKVTAHITGLADFKPLGAVPVRISLIVGGEAVSQTVDRPHVAGVYECVLKPAKAGCGQLKVEVLADGGVSAVSHPHVHVAASHDELHGHHGHDHGCEGSAANAVAFSKEQSWSIDFATDTLRRRPFGSVIRAAAQVLPSQDDRREVTAAAAGVVVYSSPNLVEGSAVTAGQQLFVIESSDMADNNMSVRLQEATSNYNAAKEDFERKQRLAEDRIVSQTDFQQAKAAYETAKAAYDNLRNNFSQDGAVVRAPISGYVQRIGVSNGSFVDAGYSVVTISQNRDLLVRAEVQPRYYGLLKDISRVNVEIPGDGQVYSLEELNGSLVSYARSTDPGSPMVPVTFRIRNHADLVSGSFVSLYIATTSNDRALVIPNTGIVEEMGNYFAFVQLTPESFEKRLITIGATDGRHTEVTSGLRAGERVVTRGAAIVRLAQGSAALDPHAGHVH